jgi:hypothetical protein
MRFLPTDEQTSVPAVNPPSLQTVLRQSNYTILQGRILLLQTLRSEVTLPTALATCSHGSQLPQTETLWSSKQDNDTYDRAVFAIVADVGYFFSQWIIIIIIRIIPVIYRNYVIVDVGWVFHDQCGGGGGGGVRMGCCPIIGLQAQRWWNRADTKYNIQITFDGGSRGNPGTIAGAGAVVTQQQQQQSSAIMSVNI